jgi:glycosyltransferase involved in cell wall biosynthesis
VDINLSEKFFIMENAMSKGLICHITSVHQWYDARIFQKECGSAAAAGFEVHLIAPNAPDKIDNGVHLHGINVRVKSRLSRMTKAVWKVYKKAKEINADLYHFHDPELLIIGLLLKKQGRKVIYDVHEDYPRSIIDKQWLPKAIRPWLARVYERLEQFVSQRMDQIVAATPHIKERFLEKNINRTTVLTNYPLLDEFYLLKANWREKEPAFCYTGVINEVRGLFEMVAAIGRTDARLIMAGNFETSKMREQAIKKPGWTQVVDLGWLSRPEVGKIYNKVMGGIVCFHPTGNYIEALPIKMFEYMAAGIPVIASHFPLWKEIVVENRCGICVDPLNPEEIGAAIRYIIENPQEAQQMGKNGRKTIRDKYNWETESQMLIELYDEILQGS